MEQQTIHPKKGLLLRKIKNQYMIVEADTDNVNMSNVYSLNHTAAELWNLINSKDHTARELAEWLCETYSIDLGTALRDVERQLAEWKSYGMIDC